MSDNTAINAWSGGDTIATDELETQNGDAVSGVKVQRVKVGFGDDGALRDVSDTYPLPVGGKVSDTPESYPDAELRPLSLTSDGRLRVRTDGYAEALQWYEPEARNILVDFPFETLTFNRSPWS